MNLPFKQYYHVRRMRIIYDCRRIALTVPMVTRRMQFDQALSVKDPDKENNNEGARPEIRVQKLLHDPHGVDTPNRLSQYRSP